MALYTALTADKITQALSLENNCSKNVAPVICVFHSITNWQRSDTVIIVDQALMLSTASPDTYHSSCRRKNTVSLTS